MVGKIVVENTLRTLFRRCVICPQGAPSCPVCAEGLTCSLQPESCTACASTACVEIGSLPGQTASEHPTPVGAIAGGAIGGVVVLVALTYLFYKFCVGNKRRQDQAWIDQKVEKRDQTTLHRTDRHSTRSVASMASTVATRASNIIQIAFIPGVTNRTPPDSPAHNVPPVPPLPFASANTSAASTPHMEQDMHFFMPGDLRDSTYSDMTQDQRFSVAPSLINRASVATTAYRSEAVALPILAQQAFPTRLAVVGVKSGATTPGSSESRHGRNAPPVPQVPKNIAGRTIVAQNVNARPIEVKKVNSGTKVPTMANLARASSPGQQSATSSTRSNHTYWNEKEVVVSKLSPTTIIEETSPISPTFQPKPSFASYHSGNSAVVSPASPLREASSNNGLNAMIEDAMNRAAQDPAHMGLRGGKSSRPDLRTQDSGPFSDSNEIGKENLI